MSFSNGHINDMNKMFYDFITACMLLVLLSSCSPKDRRPYLFVDQAGKEYRGFYRQLELSQPVVNNSGHLTVCYANGQKWMEGEYVKGKKHGVIKMWREDGSLFAKEHYKYGLKDGKLTWWHPNGKKQIEIDWVNDKKNGFWIEWDENGVETSRREFKDDRPTEIEKEMQNH